MKGEANRAKAEPLAATPAHAHRPRSIARLSRWQKTHLQTPCDPCYTIRPFTLDLPMRRHIRPPARPPAARCPRPSARRLLPIVFAPRPKCTTHFLFDGLSPQPALTEALPSTPHNAPPPRFRRVWCIFVWCKTGRAREIAQRCRIGAKRRGSAAHYHLPAAFCPLLPLKRQGFFNTAENRQFPTPSTALAAIHVHPTTYIDPIRRNSIIKNQHALKNSRVEKLPRGPISHPLPRRPRGTRKNDSR